MAKYIKLFNTHAEYQQYMAQEGILPNVSHCIEQNEVHYNPYVPAPKVAGDVYVTDGTSFEIIGNEKYFSDYASDENVTPIGVLVIPANHMTDGKNRIMSLVDMDCATPETGNLTTNNVTMYWGGYGTDINTLTNMNKVVTGETVDGEIGIDTTAYLPDESGSYSKTPHAPSPYLSDGSKNPLYFYNTTIDGVDYSLNAFSDVAGVSNTDKITAVATSQPNWQTDTTITNSSEAGYYPPACCVRRFHTVGTSAGDWYLPACGELGYVYPRLTTINDTLNRLKTAGKVAVPLAAGYYWSSTEYSALIACYVDMYGGYVGSGNKGYSYRVRAFLGV